MQVFALDPVTDDSNVADLSKKQVSAVLEGLAVEIKRSLGNKGPGMFAIPGLVKIEKKRIPARPAQRACLTRLSLVS